MRGKLSADSELRRLSFYKEELAGETNNYVHLQASAEQISATSVLRRLVEEVLESAKVVDALISEDPELVALWQRYLQVRMVRPADRVFCLIILS